MPALSDDLKVVGIKTVTFAPDNLKRQKDNYRISVIK